MSFEVKLPLFEGPFDLLLFFIERDELDIHDIPISKITNDFLDYLHHLEQMNIEVASEFILVAATLMRIKAKMLLPRPTLDETGEEIDPREELVKHLLEYKKYKSVIDQLANMEASRLGLNPRGNIEGELKKLATGTDLEAEMQDLDLFKLLRVFQRVMGKYELEKNKPIHKIVQYPFTIAGQKEFLTSKLKLVDKISFDSLIQENPDKIVVIFNFLAILELLNIRIITISIGEGFNNFWIRKLENSQLEQISKSEFE